MSETPDLLFSTYDLNFFLLNLNQFSTPMFGVVPTFGHFPIIFFACGVQFLLLHECLDGLEVKTGLVHARNA